MPECPRHAIVDESEAGLYHCWNRCVRRARLCGEDPLTGIDFTYRRDWIQERERLLAQILAVEVAWHAEMSNHIHLALRNRPDIVETWSDEEICRRMLMVHALTRNFHNELKEPTEAKLRVTLANPEKVARYRREVSSISIFMGALDEAISRKFNDEDGVTGTFWEGRFGSRKVEDGGILVLGIYLDLNQVRAGEVETPEGSLYTSAYDRILGVQQRAAAQRSGVVNDEATEYADSWLCPLTLEEGPTVDVQRGMETKNPARLSDRGLLPISISKYLEILDWAGRITVSGKRGAIPQHLAPILDRLNISSQHFAEAIEKFELWFGRAVGSLASVSEAALTKGYRWIRGQRKCGQVFG